MDSETRLGDGRYVVRGVLGEGAQGVTYDAMDTREGRPVAIKRFDVRGARGWKDVELAEREARTLASLDHPRLPRYFEHFEEDGALYLVMEKIEGETRTLLEKSYGDVSGAQILEVGRKPTSSILAGLATLGGGGVALAILASFFRRKKAPVIVADGSPAA